VSVLRVRTAIAKMMAAMKSVLGTAKIRIESRWACHATGPQPCGSTQGIHRASRKPSDTPSSGTTATTVEPRNRPPRNASLPSGLVNRICQWL
jgi:hypothetical protein